MTPIKNNCRNHKIKKERKSYFFNSSSIIALKASNGCAPIRGTPFTKNPGVPLTPYFDPSCKSFETSFAYLPESKQLSNLAWSNPRSFAYSLNVVVPPTTPEPNSLSCISQNLPCSCAHSEASAAFCAFAWKLNGKSL